MANSTQTTAKTHVINRQLLVATLVLLAASGLVFAALSYPFSSTTATSLTCVETDDGFDLVIKGITEGFAQVDEGTQKVERIDSCSSDGRITEYYCKGKNVISKRLRCPSGQVCHDGACIASSAPATDTSVAISCTDSDGPTAYSTAGTTTVTYSNGTVSTFEDNCSGRLRGISNDVIEYSCIDNREHAGNQKCGTVIGEGSTCVDGACTEAVAPRAEIFVAWASDTPIGGSVRSPETTIGKIVISNSSAGGEATVDALNVYLHYNGDTSTATTTNMLNIYYDSISPSNLVGRASLSSWVSGTRYETAFIDSNFTDVIIPKGSSKTFIITLDTTEVGRNASLSVAMDENDIEWSDGVDSNTLGAEGLPMSPQTLVIY